MTHGFVRGENVLGFPSRVDVALLYFVHAFDVTLKFGGELRAGRRDICHDQMFDGVGREFGGEGDSHGDLAAPVWYVRAHRKEVGIEALHRMAEEGDLGERMRSEEVEDILSHYLVIHRSCVGRRTVVAEILRHRRAQSEGDLDRAMRRALGRRPVVEGHGGTPWIAIANSISCHCHAVSRTVGENAGKNDTHNSPWRMTSGRSVFELCLGWRASYLRSTGATPVRKYPVMRVV